MVFSKMLALVYLEQPTGKHDQFHSIPETVQCIDHNQQSRQRELLGTFQSIPLHDSLQCVIDHIMHKLGSSLLLLMVQELLQITLEMLHIQRQVQGMVYIFIIAQLHGTGTAMIYDDWILIPDFHLPICEAHTGRIMKQLFLFSHGLILELFFLWIVDLDGDYQEMWWSFDNFIFYKTHNHGTIRKIIWVQVSTRKHW